MYLTGTLLITNLDVFIETHFLLDLCYIKGSIALDGSDVPGPYPGLGCQKSCRQTGFPEAFTAARHELYRRGLLLNQAGFVDISCGFCNSIFYETGLLTPCQTPNLEGQEMDAQTHSTLPETEDKGDTKSRKRPAGEEARTVTSEYLAELPADIAGKLDRMDGPKFSRRVFPIPSYVISGLDPDKLYKIFINVTAVDNAKHKFLNGAWVQHQENAHTSSNVYQERSTFVHPSSPKTGAHWMSDVISFSSLKISNNLGARCSIVLQSMRKYQMSLVICPQFESQHSEDVTIHQAETQFVAVTQYQNEKIKQMKIEHNPFATSFRIKMSNSRSPDDNEENCEGESSSEDHSDQPPPAPRQASCLRGEWTTAPYYFLPPVCTTRTDPAANPLLPPYHHLERPKFPMLHAGQILSPSAPMFPVFPCPTNGFLPVYPGASMASVHHPLGSPTAQNNKPKGKAIPESVGSAADAPLPLVMKRSLHESLENGKTSKSQFSHDISSESEERPEKLAKGRHSNVKREDLPKLENPGPEVLNNFSPRPEVTLNHIDVWAETQEIVVSEEGRPMYPHLEVNVRGLDPERLYSFCLDLVLASPWCYEYERGEWKPFIHAGALPTPEPPPVPWSHQHPDNPGLGRHWEAHGVSFKGLRLATSQQGKNKMKVQLRRQYFPVLTIFTEEHRWQYPLGAAMFVTVSIDRNILNKPRESDYQKTSAEFSFYPYSRDANTSAPRPSFGRKQLCPRKAQSIQENGKSPFKYSPSSSSTSPSASEASVFDSLERHSLGGHMMSGFAYRALPIKPWTTPMDYADLSSREAHTRLSSNCDPSTDPNRAELG
ncbi:hypothetical protein EGW08_011240 [Elysia chlorotica]|uniref:T-box domain-containing protein n=1 Tax=Elysia chlorotica TaxID=188477 RepID=A0A433THC4_ELYCH|nr:hypothetical protein EGW08_011240 [Elysia chlorotica]